MSENYVGKHRKIGDGRHSQPSNRGGRIGEVIIIIVFLVTTGLVTRTTLHMVRATNTRIPHVATQAIFVRDPDPDPQLHVYKNTAKPAPRPRIAKKTRATTTPTPTPTRSSTPRPSFTAALNPNRWDVIAYAEKQIGEAYVWGGAGPDVWDCSGLVQVAFASQGYSMPRVSTDQHHMGNVAPISKLDPGDLVAWIGHVAIYLGHYRIIEAPRPGETVHIRTLDFRSSWDASAWGVSLNYADLPR